MDQFAFLGTILNCLGIPAVAIVALLASKLSSGEAAVRAQRRFLVLLVIMSVVTARTVTTSEPTWLIHTLTLSIMIVGSLWIPASDDEIPFLPTSITN